MKKKLSTPTLRRLPTYFRIICEHSEQNKEYIRSVEIAQRLGIDETQVRKDLSAVNCCGKPKVGFSIKELKTNLEDFLNVSNKKKAFLVGVGNLGLAIAKYKGFDNYGLEITALFDNDPQKIGLKIAGKDVFPISEFCQKVIEYDIKMAILAIPAQEAQNMANIAVDAGIKAIWNFTPLNIKTPKNIIVANQDLAADFVVLSMQLDEITRVSGS